MRNHNSEIILETKNICKSFGGIKAINDVSISIQRGDIVGLVGTNGAGKTTLFNSICGYIRPDSGDIVYDGINLKHFQPYQLSKMGISRLFQSIKLIYDLNIMDNLLFAQKKQPGFSFYNIICKNKMLLCNESKLRTSLENLINTIELSHSINSLAKDLSYGQQKLLSIACCFTSNADLLLLDEPLAGLSPEMIQRVIELISGLMKNQTVFLIEHNIEAVLKICSRVIVMVEGKVICDATPEKVRNDPNVIKAYLQ